MFLGKAGIGISTFKAQSVRPASTSKAHVSDAPIEEIFKRGHWSNKSLITKTFKRVSCFRRWYLNKYKLL